MGLLDVRYSRRGACVIVANGPSLVRNRHRLPEISAPLVGVNTCWKIRTVQYDAYVILDRAHLEVPEVREHPLLFNGSRDPRDFGMRLKVNGKVPFSFDLTSSCMGGSVTLAAMQAAVWLGWTELHVLGLDLRRIDGREHFDERPMAAGIAGQLYLFEDAAPLLEERGVRVWVTGSPKSLVTCFPHETFDEMLDRTAA